MVLATRCPHCRTTFRVVQDQLKLRGGLVRCGACKEIFNGAENLLRPTQAPAAAEQQSDNPAATATAADAAASIDNSSSIASRDDEAREAATTNAAPVAPVAPAPPFTPHPVATQAEAASDPLLRMTLMDFSHAHDEEEDRRDAAPVETAPPPQAPTTIITPAAPHPDFALPRMQAQAAPMPAAPADDELGRAIDELKRKPWRGTLFKSARPDEDAIDALDSNEPEFIAHVRQRERKNRSLHGALLGGSILLALLLVFQMLHLWRVELASSLPGLAPLLKRSCAVFGCQVGLPARIDQVTIESSELQALPNAADTFALVALLRNRAGVAQQWPSLELTLNDADEHPIARRVFTPRDYLPQGQDQAQGFAPMSEQSLKLVFSLSQLKASGYRVYLFYP